MNFVDDGKNEEDYKHINRTILDGNVMNIYLIIMEGKYVAINLDGYSYHGYYIINFYLSPCTLQEDLRIDDQNVFFWRNGL